MLLGCIADDYTGASDLANTLTRNGMRTIQYIGVPESVSANKNAERDAEAGVIALKTRSVRPADAVAESLNALRWLKAAGCSQIFFKYCSTFDSTPEGNIGPVAEALLNELDAEIAVACPAFPQNRRTVYQGHLFVGDKLLNESGMENHPLNPMRDANLVRVLGAQCTVPVGLVDLPVVSAGVTAIRERLAAHAKNGIRLAIVDAIHDAHLAAIGEALVDAPLVTGGSGVAIGLPENFRRRGLLAGGGSHRATVSGWAVVLSGSCSTATRRQVAVYREEHPSYELPVERLVEESSRAQLVNTVCAWALERAPESPLVYSTAEPDAITAVQQKFGKDRISKCVESFFGELAGELHRRDVRRFVVAGGETSGAVVCALGVRALRVGEEIDPGIPVMSSIEAPLVALALKSGNFGGEQFFSKALSVL